jgi:hypothetical protein
MKEAPFVRVDEYYGGDQHWLTTLRMRMGGCSTVTAAEICATLAGRYADLAGLYPGDPNHVTQPEFIEYAARYFKYVYPRMRGLTDIGLYLNGINDFARDNGLRLNFTTLSGDADISTAEAFVIDAIDAGDVIACLLLEHTDDVALYDITWHWFNIFGYERREAGGIDIVYATYGQKHTIELAHMWNTGKQPRGGLVRVGHADL